MYLRDYLHDLPLRALKTIAGNLGLSVVYNARIKLMNAIDRAFWDPLFLQRLVARLDDPHRLALSLVVFQYERGVSGKALVRKLERLTGFGRESIETVLGEIVVHALFAADDDDDGIRYRCPDEIAGQLRDIFLGPLIEKPRDIAVSPFPQPHLMDDLFSFLTAAYREPIQLTQKGTVRKTALEKIFSGSKACGIPPDGLSTRLRNTLVLEYAETRGLVTFGHQSVTAAGALGGWLELFPRERFADFVSFSLHRLLADDTAVLVFAGILRELSPGARMSSDDIAELLVERTMSIGGMSRLERRVRDAVAVLGRLGLMVYDDGRFTMTESGRMLFTGESIPLDAAVGDLFIVQPTFEVIAGPELHPRIRFILELFAERKKRDTVLIFHITRDGVSRAMERGMTTQEVIGFFERHSRTPLPQNVRFSLSSWADGYGQITFQSVTLMRIHDPEMATGVLHTPSISPFIIERISDVAAIVSTKHVPRIRQALKQAGFHPEVFGERPCDPLFDSATYDPASVPGTNPINIEHGTGRFHFPVEEEPKEEQ